jgi:hypothetical protein
MSHPFSRRHFLQSAAVIAGAGCSALNEVAAPACRIGNDNPSSQGDAATRPVGDLSGLARTHDLRLPDWGSYSKAYNGLSHVADKKAGLRFDLNVFPGFFRRHVMVPNVNWESGYYPWEAAPDLSYFSHRYELEWKDRVYCDVSFSAISPRARLIRAELVNRTDRPQITVLHLMASLNSNGARPDRPAVPLRVLAKLPSEAIWVDALDHTDLQFAKPRPTDSLMLDGLRRAEVRDETFVDGGGIGRRFGADPGDRVRFELHLPQAFGQAVLLVRYRTNIQKPASFEIAGSTRAALVLPAAKDFSLARLDLGPIPAGDFTLQLVSKGGAGVDLDGFVLVEAGKAGDVSFEGTPLNVTPVILPGPIPHSRLLKYADCAQHYGIAWRYEPVQVREILSSQLDTFLRFMSQNHLLDVLRGDGQGHFVNVFLRPIPLAPRSTRVIYGVAAAGSPAEIQEELKRVDAPDRELEGIYSAARSRVVNLPSVPAGEPYRFSQERMAATVLTNVVFPTYAKRSYFRHYTVGKFYDSLYTWDSGFLGLGLTELDTERAIDCLNAYTTEPGDPENAFIQHGTPLPVQHYLFLELWNRTQSRGLLEYFYPRLRQYHQFLAGRLGSSTTRTLKSNLLKTWDYFYNTGWDDYPPQVHIHRERMAAGVATAVTTSHAIRTARILAQTARVLGASGDIPEYEQDIAAWAEALQKHSWDPRAGYFSYVLHDKDGEPASILRHESGKNFNMGLDGVMPLLAGVCTSQQRQRLLGHLQAAGELWTPIGLSTVDQSAPYYRKDGYWNGAVWFPHQWFVWKSMLDLGESDFAGRIAQTALDLWKTEVDDSYHCFEHFLIESRRGAGWHQFSGLSTPVLLWFAAYYRPGRLTVGLDAWVHTCRFSPDHRSLSADLELRGRQGGACVVLANMGAGRKHHARWNGTKVETSYARSGTLQVGLPSDAGRGRLEISSTS